MPGGQAPRHEAVREGRPGEGGLPHHGLIFQSLDQGPDLGRLLPTADELGQLGNAKIRHGTAVLPGGPARGAEGASVHENGGERGGQEIGSEEWEREGSEGERGGGAGSE